VERKRRQTTVWTGTLRGRLE